MKKRVLIISVIVIALMLTLSGCVPNQSADGTLGIWDIIILPFAWLFNFLYGLCKSYALTLILFSLVTKILLFYFSARGKKSTMAQQRLMPKQKELEKQFKDKQKYQEALMKMYQEEGISPMGGCLWMFIPMPVLFALIAVIRAPLINMMHLGNEAILKLTDAAAVAGQWTDTFKAGYYVQLNVAAWISQNFEAVKASFPDIDLTHINFNFFGLDLSQIPKAPWVEMSWLLVLPLLSLGSSYLSMHMTQKFNGTQAAMQGNMKTMMLLMPLMSLYFGFIMPAAMSIYWISQNLFSIVQEYILTKHYTKVLKEEDERRAALAARRKAAEEKQKEEERAERAAKIAEKGESKKSKTYKVKKDPSNK